jgi:uncharacterized protein YukE
MAMGANDRVALDGEMQAAKQVCADYRAKISTLLGQLEDTVNSLLNDDFKGEAADGFKDFYDKNVKAFFESGETFDQYLGMFDKEGEGLFDSIEKALTVGEGVDPSLGQNNKTIGQSTEGQA